MRCVDGWHEREIAERVAGPFPIRFVIGRHWSAVDRVPERDADPEVPAVKTLKMYALTMTLSRFSPKMWIELS